MKYIYKLSLFIKFLLSGFCLFAQDYPASTIPEDLKTNANAVIRNYNESFIQNDINNAVYKANKVITILNKKGDSFAHFYIYGDKFREINNFSGILRDASGKIVKKIKKSDLITSSISDDALATDMYTIAYECLSPTYPFTIEYTYELKFKNGILSYPAFNPVGRYYLSVENADYKIEIPEDIKLRSNENYKSNLHHETINGKNIYTASAKNINAIAMEPLSPPYKEVFPVILMAPAEFCYDSFCGNMSNWNNYGLWVHNLLKGRDKLPADLVTRLNEMVKGKKTDEKARIIYDYLQNNTRYVSIQLGIGGFQPTDAMTVAKTKLSDCKGLTNLMMAMLKAVGISSEYCVISTIEKNLYPDFPNFNQADHVILMIPHEKDSIWLECTSQTFPFGYIPKNLAGHNALIISEEGGRLCRLPSYTDKQNSKETLGDIFLDENGSARGKFTFTERLAGYEETSGTFRSKDRERIAGYIAKNIKMPGIQINEYSTTENKSALPSISLTANVKSADFANKTGKRLFVPVCPLIKYNYDIFSSSDRSLPIYISAGFSESDTIRINIPKSYIPESLPKDISKNTPFGIMETKVVHDESTIVYIQNIDIFSGMYDKSKYNEIKDFFSAITAATKRNLVLKKND